MPVEPPFRLRVQRLKGYRVLLVHPNERIDVSTVETLSSARLVPRDDLVGVNGPRPGSGRHDGEFWEHERWFLKTRAARSFTTEEDAVRSFARLTATKLRLGVLTPVRSIVALVVGREHAYEVWTIAPRLCTVREWVSDAYARGDLATLRRALIGYAHCLGLALESAFTTGLSLDANPANFAMQGARARYIDDDVVERGDALGVEDAFLARFQEYADVPSPIWGEYLLRFAAEVRMRRGSFGSLDSFCERLTLAAQLRRGALPWADSLIVRLRSD